jgi:AraC-like DNA-binding protein
MQWALGYREYRPPAALREAVYCTWTTVVPPGGAPTIVLPDACTDLIWQSGRGVFIAGPDTGPVHADLPPGTILAGVRLRPGAGPALGIPLTELLNQRVDAQDFETGPGRELCRRLPGSLPPPVALRRLSAIVSGMVAAAPPDPLVSRAAVLLRDPAARTAGIAAEIGVSERQLLRRSHVAAGYGPATLHRVLRFRRFVSRLDAAVDRPDLARIAAEAGYADQAHLTRECGRLAGLPPGALARARWRPPAPPLAGRPIPTYDSLRY